MQQKRFKSVNICAHACSIGARWGCVQIYSSRFVEGALSPLDLLQPEPSSELEDLVRQMHAQLDRQTHAQLDEVPTTPPAHDAADRSKLRGHAQHIKKLTALGAVVYSPGEDEQLSWDTMAGYDAEKRLVEDVVLLSITHADAFQAMAKQTRRDGKCHRPKVCTYSTLC